MLRESNQVAASSPPELHALEPLVMTALAGYVQCGHTGFSGPALWQGISWLCQLLQVFFCSRHILWVSVRRVIARSRGFGRAPPWVAVGHQNVAGLP